MEETDFVNKLNEKYFSLKKYTETDGCPLEHSEIDTRFFDNDGSPNKRLQDKVSELKSSVKKAGYRDNEYEIYVIGGVAAKFDKKGYSSDLDLQVCIPSNSDAVIKYWDGDDNIATKLVSDINDGKIPDREGRKKDGYTDVIVTKYPPHGETPFIGSETHTAYNYTKNKWVTITEKTE